MISTGRSQGRISQGHQTWIWVMMVMGAVAAGWIGGAVRASPIVVPLAGRDDITTTPTPTSTSTSTVAPTLQVLQLAEEDHDEHDFLTIKYGTATYTIKAEFTNFAETKKQIVSKLALGGDDEDELPVPTFEEETNTSINTSVPQPTDNYIISTIPTYIACPENVTSDTIRRFLPDSKSQSINEREQSYVESRTNLTYSLYKDYFNNNSIPIEVADFFNDSYNAFAISGGGYRALLIGAAFIDSISNTISKGSNLLEVSYENGTNITSTLTKQFDGAELELFTYSSGLSGGSWMLLSLTGLQYPLIEYMINEVWLPMDGLPSISLKQVSAFYKKKTNGFKTSIVDIWSMLVGQRIGTRQQIPNVGSYINNTSFQNYSIPYPLIQIIQQDYNVSEVNVTDAVWEASPYEFGSYDPRNLAFIDTHYMGTYFDENNITQHSSSDLLHKITSGISNIFGDDDLKDKTCVINYDSTSFIGSMSSNIFAYASTALINSTDLDGLISDIEQGDKGDTGILPNPFYSVTGGANIDQEDVYFVDGGMSGQNVPLVPLLINGRNVSMITAVDASADTDQYYTNGVSLYKTQAYLQDKYEELGIQFPPLPDNLTVFNSEGYNTRATIFGCGSLVNDTSGYEGPAILYLPNYQAAETDFVGLSSNYSTEKMTYEPQEILALFQNWFGIMNEFKSNEESCLPCAMAIGAAKANDTLATLLDTRCGSCYTDFCYAN